MFARSDHADNCIVWFVLFHGISRVKIALNRTHAVEKFLIDVVAAALRHFRSTSWCGVYQFLP